MTIRHTQMAFARRVLGFSMIDVLIAIIVLATALLALAALQGAMTRNSADARARSQIAAYTEGVMDQLRVGGYSNIPTAANAFASNPQTATITPSSTTCPNTTSQAFEAYCAQRAAGVSNLSTTITVNQYAITSATNPAFKLTTGNPIASSGTYKQVSVATTWTDATGQTGRSVRFDTIISPVTVDTSNTALVVKSLAIGASTGPIVREANPANTLGVIPIAVSSSANSAATNPAPVVTNTGTTFSTFTYQSTASAFGGNVLNQRVDTKVIQCSCQYGGALSNDANNTFATIFAQPFRPTYWDGTQYVSPALTGAATSTTGIDPASSAKKNPLLQDTNCDTCCRDRNDSSSDPAGTVKFDSFSGSTSHYQYNSSGVLTAVTTGTYIQACRLIRVGGVYATATDIHNYFFGLVATDDCVSETKPLNTPPLTPVPTGCISSLAATDVVPSPSTETSYANFVKDYLYNSLTSLKAGTGPWVASTSPQASPADSASNLYNGSPYNLNSPTNIPISIPNTESRWLHARGLYIDHLETKAATALANAITNCGATDQTSVENCAFPVLPFTTVNMTELANWSSSNNGIINVSDTAVIDGFSTTSSCTPATTNATNTTCPRRGNVTLPSTQVNGAANAIATTYVTNSGLTGVTTNQANSAYDTLLANNLTDQKQFTVSGGTPSGGVPVYFDVALTGLSWMSAISNASLDPSVSWSGSVAQIGALDSGAANAYLTNSGGTYTALYAGAVSTAPIPVFVKTPVTAPVGLNVNVQYFNNSDNQGTETVSCTAIAGGTSANFKSTAATQCYNYAVNPTNITINGANAGVTSANVTLLSGTTDGGMREGAVIVIPKTPGISSTTNTIAGATSLSIPFTLTSTTVAPGACSCQDTGCSVQSYTPGTCAP